jgi:tight adherence protein B
MQAVVLTFVVVVVVVLATYWALLVRPESQSQSLLKRRLKTSSAAPTSQRQAKVARDEERLSAVGPLNLVLERGARLSSPLQKLITQAGMRITVGTLVLAIACCFFGAWALVALTTGFAWIGLLAGLVAACVPYAFVRYKASRRVVLFEEQFPEAIDLIARALRAGHAFTTGLAMVAEEAPQPVAGEFRLLYDQQNFGMPLGDALRAFAERVPLLDARFFVTAVMTQREAGGNLAEVLDNLGSVIRERFKVKRQIRVLSAHGRITGFVLASLPPVLAIAMLVVTPEHMKVLVNDPLGPPMVLFAIALQIVGSLIIRRIVDIEY